MLFFAVAALYCSQRSCKAMDNHILSQVLQSINLASGQVNRVQCLQSKGMQSYSVGD